MGKIENFEDLQIWILAREIASEIWKLFLETELGKDYSFRNQMNRSSGSIMDNIAEGFERNGNREFIQFLSIAKASCGELRSQLYRCHDRKYISIQVLNELINKTTKEGKQIGAFIQNLKKSERKGSKFDS